MKARGFTLIELMVVVSILGVLLGLSIPAYNAFNRRQSLQQATETLVQNMRDAQNRATAGDQSVDCPLVSPAPLQGQAKNYPFEGWYIELSNNALSYKISGSCKGPTQSVDIAAKQNTVRFPKDVTIRSISSGNPTYILFEPVTQTVKYFSNRNFMNSANQLSPSQASIIMEQAGETKTYTISISPTGVISSQ